MNRTTYYATRHAVRRAGYEDAAESAAALAAWNSPCVDSRGPMPWPTRQREQAVLAPLSERDRDAVMSRPFRMLMRRATDVCRLPMGPRASQFYERGRPGTVGFGMPLCKRIALRNAMATLEAERPEVFA